MRFIAILAFFAAVVVALPAASPDPLPEAEADGIVEPKACCL